MSAKGLKRVCQDCRTPFYDFNKRPVICPKCNTEISGVRAPSPVEDEPAKKPAAVQDENEIKTDSATVSLDDIEEHDDDIDEEELMRVEEDLDLDSIDDHLEDDD